MKNLRSLFILIFLAAAVYGIYKLTRPKLDDRAFLLGLPAHVSALAEKQQGGEIKKFIAKDYSDKRNRNFQDVGGIITAYMLRGGAISIYTLNPEVEDLNLAAEIPTAVLKFQAALAQGSGQAGALDVIPESASYYNFRLEMRKTPDEGWQVYSGEWSPALSPSN